MADDIVFEQAEIAKYSDAERRQYEASQKEYWDYTSTLETAERKGEVKGALKEKEETVHRLMAMGLTIEQIAQGGEIGAFPPSLGRRNPPIQS